MNKNLGDVIKEGLKRKRWQQKDLADFLSVNHSSVSQWCNNVKKPQADDLLKIIDVLDLVPELFPGYSKSEKRSESLDKLEQLIEELQEKVDQQQDWIQMHEASIQTLSDQKFTEEGSKKLTERRKPIKEIKETKKLI